MIYVNQGGKINMNKRNRRKSIIVMILALILVAAMVVPTFLSLLR